MLKADCKIKLKGKNNKLSTKICPNESIIKKQIRT